MFLLHLEILAVPLDPNLLIQVLLLHFQLEPDTGYHHILPHRHPYIHELNFPPPEVEHGPICEPLLQSVLKFHLVHHPHPIWLVHLHS